MGTRSDLGYILTKLQDMYTHTYMYIYIYIFIYIHICSGAYMYYIYMYCRYTRVSDICRVYLIYVVCHMDVYELGLLLLLGCN